MKISFLFIVLTWQFFPAISQERFSVLITEIMADPSPSQGLPEVEWVEIRNVTTHPINLKQWRIGDANGMSNAFIEKILAPDSSIIICSGSSASLLSPLGTVLTATNFPSLDNNGELLYLQNNNGKIIHSLEYSLQWYGNKLKETGGWSLEMIDINNPCHGTNWKASVDTKGGTPGKSNSVTSINPDPSPPQLINAFTEGTMNIFLVFDETLDSASAINTSNYSISVNSAIQEAICVPPLFNQVKLKLSSPISPGEIFIISVSSIQDCSNNSSGKDSIRVGIPEIASKADLLINEILFNPRPAGNDYAEYYNKSQKILNAEKLYLANRNINGDIINIRAASSKPFYIFPGDHIVFTENVQNLSLHYLVNNRRNILPVSLPTLPDDEGSLLLLNEQGEIIDELHYRDDWHFKLIQQKEGISLERIDVNNKTQDAKNWHSAASTAGYGTPGYKNSQSSPISEPSSSFFLSHQTISPGNDGHDDVLTIVYAMESPGFMVTITIFDAAGRVVKNLVRNELAGLKGQWNWDGLGEKGSRLPTGIYVVHADMFNSGGQKRIIKKPLVIVSK